ncbi:thiamine phosphate synthase [Pseudochelatococcus contaminans]|uniref:Thiamine-phosphate pyrophosphorylase n=1 Tax=Pseudochelatococcus contaminans TaxID=1538103 RepID=A0A7W5Z1R2_9HYPH|nr:thiamine-phosphate pyrophosphorylase [Pseudochelatococcus contaminans]
MSRPLPQPALLVITDRHQLAGGAAAIGEVAGAAFAAGCRWISLREKDLPVDEQVTLARDLVRRAAAFGATVTVHGAADIALMAGAHGVHLPETGDSAAARQLLGPDALIGQSVHAPAQAALIDPADVDYIIAGPVFPTASKPGYGPALGAAGLAAIVGVSQVPVLPIGGVEEESVAACLAAGASGVAVMGAVMRSPAPETVIAPLLARMQVARGL